MEKHILDILGFETVREGLKQYTVSEGGAALISRQEPESDFAAWREKQDIFCALKLVLSRATSFPSVSFPEISHYAVKAAKEGAVLEAAELAAVYVFLKSAAVLRRFLFSLEGFETVRFLGDFEEYIDLRNEISRYLLPNGALKEDSIRELTSIKKRIAATNKLIARTADEYLQNAEYRSFWQENNITMRDGRAVLPLKANFKGRVQGIIHSSSFRGNTIFIEPAGLVEKNNQLMELEEEYRREIFRILRNLTFKVGFVSEGLVRLSQQIALFDSYYSRVRFTDSYGGTIPEHSEKGMALYEAKHLLLGEKAVAVDIIVGKDTNILLISGPNTGGKTVALKTAALIVLMNQFNLGIPAREGSSIPFFDNVLADIGDGQSIADSLSTFSAHMKNISHILEAGTGKSLILLDEPGTGTDPDEGAAIAMAVFDRIAEKNALALVTTHQSVIKNYAFANAFAENISVKYDPETFTPEYKLVYGVPGESFGIDIAGKNGMPEDIISKAREYLGSEKININLLLKQISEKHAQLADREAAIKRAEQEIREKKREIELKGLQLRQKEYEIKKSESTAYSRLVSETSSRLENMVRELREGEITKEKTRGVKDFIEEIHGNEEKLKQKAEALKTEAAEEDIVYKQDDPVYVGESRQDGVIIREMKKGKYLVAVGQLRITVDKKDLVPGKVRQEKNKVSRTVLSSYRKPEFELDIRGCRLDEAIAQLERQMDSALLCGLNEFSVIHGMGEGILQKGVRDFLEDNSNVESFRFATPENGGFGKTIVKLGK